MNKRIFLFVILIFSIFIVSAYAQECSLDVKVDSGGVVTLTGVLEKGEYILKVYKKDLLVHIDQLETDGEISYKFIPRIKEEDAIYRLILGEKELDFKYDTRRSRSSNKKNNQKKEDIDGNKVIEKALSLSENPLISLENDKDELVQIFPSIIQTLGNEDRPLIVENTCIRLKFPSQSLITSGFIQALETPNAKLELGSRDLTKREKAKILRNAHLGESTGIFEIGGRIFNLTAQITTKNSDGTKTTEKIESFIDPIAVTIDLSDLNLSEEDIAQLTSVRYRIGENGEIIEEILGGTYDKDTQTFTFYTDQFSLYGVVKAEKLSQINLSIGNLESSVNGKAVINDIAPIIMNNRTMVPVRFIAENLGAEVDWIEETRTVVIKLDGETLTMVIDKPIEGFDTPPTIVNSRTLVPLRYVSERLGANVLWFPNTRSVQIVK